MRVLPAMYVIPAAQLLQVQLALFSPTGNKYMLDNNYELWLILSFKELSYTKCLCFGGLGLDRYASSNTPVVRVERRETRR